MADLVSLLSDPELGGTSFTVRRTIYRRDQDRSAVLVTRTVTATGCVHPGSPELLTELPEENRADAFIVVYTAFALSLGQDDGISYAGPDQILFQGKTWRVVSLRPWSAFGFSRALAVEVPTDL